MASSTRLQSWIANQLATGLPALAGAQVSARIPVQVSLLNELLAQGLADAREGRPRTDGGATAPPVDAATLARMVRQLRVDAAPGVITLEVEAGVDG